YGWTGPSGWSRRPPPRWSRAGTAPDRRTGCCDVRPRRARAGGGPLSLVRAVFLLPLVLFLPAQGEMSQGEGVNSFSASRTFFSYPETIWPGCWTGCTQTTTAGAEAGRRAVDPWCV